MLCGKVPAAPNMKRILILALLLGLLTWLAAYTLSRVNALGQPRSESVGTSTPGGAVGDGTVEGGRSDPFAGVGNDDEAALQGSGGEGAAREIVEPVVEPEARLLFGRVVDAAGQPAVGAEVYARSGGWYSIVPIELAGAEGPTNGRVQSATDEEGGFQFTEGLTPGASLALVVVHRNHATYRALRVPLRATPHDTGTISLRPGLTIHGSVLGPGGAPIAGVEVLLAASRGVDGLEGSFPGRGRRVALTDARGSFTAAALAPGRWHLLFVAEDFAVEERKGEQRSEATVVVPPVRLGAGHSLSGRIVGLPEDRVADVYVEARPEELDASAQARPRRSLPSPGGSFSIAGIAPSERVRLRVASRSASDEYVPVAEVPQVFVSSDAVGVELLWGDPISLKARVVGPFGRPVESFTALAQLGYFGGTHEIGGENAGETLTHHPDGVLHASGMGLYSEERTVALLIRAVGFEDFGQEIDGLQPGRSVDAGEIELVPVPVLSVMVQGPEAQAISGAKVRITSGESRAVEVLTDASGLARMNIASDEASQVVVSHPGWCTQSEVVDTAVHAEVRLRVELSRGGALEVSVTSLNASSLSGYSIRATPLLPSLTVDRRRVVRSESTNEAGVARFDALGAGLWRVARRRPVREWRSAASAEESGTIATVELGGLARVTLLAPEEGVVFGQVRDSSGGLSIATLRLAPRDHRKEAKRDRNAWHSPYNRVANAYGEFRFERIPHGEYTLEIEHDSRAMIAHLNLTVSDDEDPLDIVLPDSELRARVVDAFGQPLAGVAVELRVEESGYVGWSDGRRAWTDERGELKQAWFQDALHKRSSGSDGAVQFLGIVPMIEGSLHLEDRWNASLGTPFVGVPAGEVLDVGDMIYRAGGEVAIVPKGAAPRGWTLRCTPLPGEPAVEVGGGVRSHAGRTDPVVLARLPPGAYRIQAIINGVTVSAEDRPNDSGGAQDRASLVVNVTARQRTTLELDLEAVPPALKQR